jgi:hypothetical protein
MLKGHFGKRIGYLVIAAGILTFLTPLEVIMEVPTVILFIGIVLGAVWQLVAGAILYRMGQVVPAGAADVSGERANPKMGLT